MRTTSTVHTCSAVCAYFDSLVWRQMSKSYVRILAEQELQLVRDLSYCRDDKEGNASLVVE